MKDSPVSEKTWDEIEKEIFTPEEIAESDLRVAEICKMIQERETAADTGKKCSCVFFIMSAKLFYRVRL